MGLGVYANQCLEAACEVPKQSAKQQKMRSTNTEMLTDGRADIADPFYNVIGNDLKIAAVESSYLYQTSAKYLKPFSAKHH